MTDRIAITLLHGDTCANRAHDNAEKGARLWGDSRPARAALYYTDATHAARQAAEYYGHAALIGADMVAASRARCYEEFANDWEALAATLGETP